MTIRKGEPWGEATESPGDLRVVATDRAAREWVVAQEGRTLLPVGLGGGDLAHTLGGGTTGRFPGTVVKAPIDLLRVQADDGRTTVAVAHVIARRSWWRGEVFFAMNAQYVGEYDVAPRSHPNDGKVDTLRVSADMSWRERLQAKGRARTGTHLPHPKLTARQSPLAEARFQRPLVVWVDGVRWGTAAGLTITVEPDALTVYA
ncbi:MAG: hypothetical protein ABMA25_02235 [Ilumatobacteraceae bacterium]